MKIGVSGTFHGRVDGVQPGDVVEVDDQIGARYCAMHYAEPVVDRKEERAIAPKGEERADDPESEPAPAAAKRGPRQS